MSGIGDWFSGQWSKLTGKTPQATVAPIQKAIPSVTTSEGAQAMGMASEPAGVTSGGGRRRKTRRGGKKLRKTRSRKH
jgi:hypothetical protein